MSIEKTKEYMAIMQAYLDGKKIELLIGDKWYGINPDWTCSADEYRIAPSSPDSINWSHVAPEFKWMARDKNGRAYLYDEEPVKDRAVWFGQNILASNFASYVKGTCDWTESLVERPE